MVLAVALVVGLAVGFLVSDRTPTYRAAATVYVGSRQFAVIADSPNASAIMDRVDQTFAAMMHSDTIAAEAIQLAHVARTPSQVAAATDSSAVANTNYIGVFVTDTDPDVAQALANGVVHSFVAQVQTLEPTIAGTGNAAVTSVFQEATRPSAPLPKPIKKNLVLGGLSGLAAGVALIALLNYLDVSVRSIESVERETGLAVLGTIPILPRDPGPGSAVPSPAG